MDEKQIEAYLSRLDSKLNHISAGDRAEIILEIKSHILDAIESSETGSVDTVLKALGGPEDVANKYLIEKGISITPPSRLAGPSTAKWIVIGLLGFFGMSLIATIVIISNFTPLIEVNEKMGTVRILGGLIDVSKDSKLDINFSEKSSSVKGILTVGDKIDLFNIRFSNGKVNLIAEDRNSIGYRCKTVGGSGKQIKIVNNEPVLDLDLSKFAGIKCSISYPKHLKINIDGANGKIGLENPTSSAVLKISNGKVYITPLSGIDYKFENSIGNGPIDGEFISSPNKNAVLIKTTVSNGKIGLDD